MSKMSVTSTQAATRWSQGLSGASQKITDGVNAVTTAPSASAVKAQAKMLANLTAAVNSGKWAAGLNAVTLQDWQNAMTTKGIPRIAQGAQAAQTKMQAFYDKLLPFEQSLQSRVQAMPNMNQADAKARMNAWFDGMLTFKK